MFSYVFDIVALPQRSAAALMLGAAAIGAFLPTHVVSAQPAMQRAQPPQSSRAEPSALVEISRTPYQAYLAADCLTGSNFCKFVGEAVTTRRRLEIRRVACQGWHSSTTPPNFVVISELHTAAGIFVRRIDFPETRYTRVGTNTVWAISEQVLTFIPAGHRLEIRLNSASTGVGSYGCTLSGYLVTFGPS